MPAYWMVRSSEVRDQEALKKYGELWQPIAERYQAKFGQLFVGFTKQLLHCFETSASDRTVGHRLPDGRKKLPNLHQPGLQGCDE